MAHMLFQPLELPCGTVLKNRIAKSAMSDSLGDGYGNPTGAQIRLYERWAEGGIAVSIIGEVQGNPNYAEKPGNLLLDPNSDKAEFEKLARRGATNGAKLWLQLGHAGAMAHPPISTPKGPSALDLSGLTCAALTAREIEDLPGEFARTAALAKSLGFGGVQIHAAHGFLLSQFLSPLFNRRGDAYGGSLENRMRLLLDVIEEVRNAVGPGFPVALKLNSSDQLQGGFEESESLKVMSALDQTSIDLIDISGGTYFPGAKSASDSAGGGPYFLDFAKRARTLTTKPLMLTGGFKTLEQAGNAVSDGYVDVVGLARALVLVPDLANHWQRGTAATPDFPRFVSPPEGGVTAWYTMRLTGIGEDREATQSQDLETAIRDYEARDMQRIGLWNSRRGA
ncbi:NADH:flavin oxidoreductase/NADH oxidase family protein [Hoeflea sp. AS60]|uniref:NADH:flavin oxidoreductase/NADH oxidase family protein n=1 Tax=Hoeflea sp. AS60 TaxID=3135780 RepID=UPI0031778F67